MKIGDIVVASLTAAWHRQPTALTAANIADKNLAQSRGINFFDYKCVIKGIVFDLVCTSLIFMELIYNEAVLPYNKIQKKDARNKRRWRLSADIVSDRPPLYTGLRNINANFLN